MTALISIYIISGILSFTQMIYAQKYDNDVTVFDVIRFLVMAITPVLNTFLVLLFTVCFIHDHYVEGGFNFLNKVVIKRKD